VLIYDPTLTILGISGVLSRQALRCRLFVDLWNFGDRSGRDFRLPALVDRAHGCLVTMFNSLITTGLFRSDDVIVGNVIP